MLLTVVDELVEQRAGLIFLTKLAVAESGVEDLVGLRIVVVHGGCGLSRAFGAFLITSEEVEEVVILRTIELAFAQMVREHEAFLQELLGTSILWVLQQQLLGNLQTTHLILPTHLAFAAFPRMEDAVVDDFLRFLIATQHIEQGGLFEHEVVATLNELNMLLVEGQTLCV